MAPSRIVVIVIDGLDECSDPAAVLDALALGAKNVSVRLRLLASSRPYAEIQSKFKKTSLYHLTTQNHFHDINPTTLSNDVAIYLTWSLREIASRTAHRNLPSPWPAEDQLAELISRASGLFIIGSTYTRYIDDPFVDDPGAQLKRILSRKRGIGTSPLAELDALYDQVLDDLRQSLKTPHELRVARDIIEHVILAHSWITLTICSGLMSMEPSEVRPVLRRLTAVILLPDDEDAPIIPFHASFGEYIQDEVRCTIRELAVDTMSARGRIAERCIATIVSAARDGVVGVEPLWGETLPQLSFASMSLADHVHISSYNLARGDGEIFIQSGIWTWLNLLRLSGGVQPIEDHVKRADFASLLHVKGLRADATTYVATLMAANHVEVVVGARRWNMRNYPNFFIESVTVNLHSPTEIGMMVSCPHDLRKFYNMVQYLERTANLDTMSRVRLALEVAKEVRYIHETYPFHYHGPLVPDNVLVSAEGKPFFGPPEWITLVPPQDWRDRNPFNYLSNVNDEFQNVHYWPDSETPKHTFTSLQELQTIKIWDFSCLLFEIMTTFNPLGRYGMLAESRPALGYEPEDYFWDGDLGAHVYQARYETAMSALLDTFEGPEEVKAVLKGCWAIKAQDRSSIRVVVEQLEVALEAIGRTAELP